MPNLTLINGISVEIVDMEIRKKQHRVNTLLQKLPQYMNQYLVGKGELAMPVWYIQDEVGSSIMHSDQAQVSVFPFMHSPANSAQDTNAVSYNIMWPIKDLKFNEGIYKDNLLGYSEERFRSARLHTWFYTPNDYFAKSLEALRSKAIDYDVEGNFNKIQDGTPLRGSLDLPKLKIYSED